MSTDPREWSASPDAAAARRIRELEQQVAAVSRGSRKAVADWKTPGLLSSFANAGGGQAPAGYYIDSVGRVYLRGVISVPNNAARPLNIFSLAPGYRPVYLHRFVSAGEFADSISSVIIDVTTGGNVNLSFGGQFGQTITLDVVQFRTV